MNEMAKTIEQGVKDAEKKTEDIRVLEKLGGDHFKLTITNEGNRTNNVKEFDKKELKAVYEDLIQNVANIKTMVAEQKQKAKILTNLPDDEEEKIEEFMHMLAKVNQFKEAQTAKMSIPNMDKQLEFLEKGMREIERVVPETLRNK